MPLSISDIRSNDPVLADLVVGAIPRSSTYLARQMFTTVTVGGSLATGKVYVEEAAAFMGDPSVSLQRAPGGPIQAIGDEPGSFVSYETQKRSAHTQPLPKEHVERSQIGDLHRRAQRQLAGAIRVKEEDDASSLLFSATTGWPTVAFNAIAGGTGAKIGAAGAKPVLDIDIRRIALRDRAQGEDPPDCVIGIETLDGLRKDEFMRGYYGTFANGIASGGDRLLTRQRVIEILKTELAFKRIWVCSGRKRTSQPGVTPITTGNIFGDGLWMGWLKPSDDEGVERAASVRVNGDGSLSRDVDAMKLSAIMLIDEVAEANMEWDWKHQGFVHWFDEGYTIQVLNTALGDYISDCV